MLTGQKCSSPTDSKICAKFQFVKSMTLEPVGERFDGQIHLFEHQYNERMQFWYGVAYVNRSWDETRAAMKEAGTGGFVGLAVRVELNDARSGIAHVCGASLDQFDTDYIWLPLSGFTSLNKG
jgi:hypothetical protein